MCLYIKKYISCCCCYYLYMRVVSSLSPRCVNSYQRTQMNLRGLSYWMLPSPTRFTTRLLPFDQGALTAARPRGCHHFTQVPMLILYRLLFHASSGAPSTTSRQSESADPSPRLAGEELTLPHALNRLKIVRQAWIHIVDQFLQSTQDTEKM